tara:strand:- start:257 stop:1312 length:1056 start_codon:yes stop_codon:yes gene_type:complete
MAYTTINKHTDYFNTALYQGNDSASHSITGVGFQPDLTVIKNRSQTADLQWQDSVRGKTGSNYKYIQSTGTGAETAQGDNDGLNTFGTDGFTVGFTNSGGWNRNPDNYVGWSWKANGSGSSNTDGSITSTVSENTTAGFSIVKYTGNGTAGATIGHGLGVVPTCMIVKSVSATEHWQMYHHKMGATKYIELSSSAAEVTSSDRWNNTAPTSSVFSVGGHTSVNTNGTTYIAYCFAEKTGYSKFGSYTGNGSTDGPFIYTGFKPAWVMTKRTDSTSAWQMFDNTRSPFNPTDKRLKADDNSAEDTNLERDFLSNGFKIRTNNATINGSGVNMIYMAFGQSLVGNNNVPCTAR